MKLSLRFLLGLALLLPAPVLAHGSGAGVSATLAPDEPEYTLNQPVTAHLVVKNSSDQPVQIDFGRNFQGNIHLLVNGASVPPPGLPPEGGVSFPGVVTLAPGESFSRRLLLDDWYRFAEPGTYQVRLVLEAPPLRLEGAATVVVGRRDPERLAEACSELSRQARSPEAETSTLAARALSYVDDEACLGSLAEVLRKSFHGKEEAILGLLRIGTEAALRALAESWDALRWDQQALAFNEAERRGKKEALKEELRKAGRSDTVKLPGVD